MLLDKGGVELHADGVVEVHFSAWGVREEGHGNADGCANSARRVRAAGEGGVEYSALGVAEFAIAEDGLVYYFLDEEEGWESCLCLQGRENGFERGVGGDGVEVCRAFWVLVLDWRDGSVGIA